MALKSKKTKLKSWSQFKTERFKKDPDEALEFLKASIEINSDKPELITAAIKQVTEALDLSLEDLAKKAGISRASIYKALGKNGNPTLFTLSTLLGALGLRISVERKSA